MRRTHAVDLHLAGANHARRLAHAVFNDILTEQHESGFEYHAEEIEERRANQGELDRRDPVLVLEETTDKASAFGL